MKIQGGLGMLNYPLVRLISHGQGVALRGKRGKWSGYDTLASLLIHWIE